MNKRFNIRAAFEEAKEAQATAQLEVDKEAQLSPEEKAIRDSALQLAAPTDESEGAKKEDDIPAADPELTPEQTPSDDMVEDIVEGDTDNVLPDEVATPSATEAPVEEGKADIEEAVVVDDEVPAIDPDSEEGKEKAKQEQSDKEQEEDADKVATTLESIAGVMTRSLDKGGMTTMSASAVALVLEQLYERVGMTLDPRSFPAMESYDSISSRKRNTQTALESIGKAIAKVRLAIEKSASKRTKEVVESIDASAKPSA